MKLTTRTWSTPLVIGSGIFVAFSGTLMFWRLGGPMETAHEWIGLAFTVGIVLHMLNHWRSFRNYFSNRKGLAVIGACMLGTAFFVGQSLMEGDGPSRPSGRAMAAALSEADLTSIAAMQGVEAAQLTDALAASGIVVASPEQTISDVAFAADQPADAVLAVIFPRR